ncbi:hypothetical protein FQN52_002794 [Onygenales sp. PD_12]|nr:hypothetical protein FQN52_002794 [Onygenales sp. PD_12]
MPVARSILHGQITYSEAQKKETNILQELTYASLAASFKARIESKSETIKAIVAHHLYLNRSCCIDIAHPSEWLNGSFNLCVPVSVRTPRDSVRVLMRFPLPYKTAETIHPGNGDEKTRCEAGTYAWIAQECPDIPIASLWGFGLSTGQKFTALRNTPLFINYFQHLKRKILSLLGRPVPCQYMQHKLPMLDDLGTGYLLLEYVEDGKMLSESYALQFHDATRRNNLFRDLAKIQLILSRKTFPRIGSIIIDDDGVLGLSNRPLALEICQLENENIPVDIPRTMTYSTVDTYIHDLLSLHDSRLRYQLNGATSMQDCISQMSALSTMRTVYPEFFDRKLRSGPFVPTLTDLHPSNLFVDDDWHIKKLLDLEWMCIRPVEMQHPPYWLTNQAVDRIDEVEYSKLGNEFIDILEEEERLMTKESTLPEEVTNGLTYAELLRRLWRQGTFWYCFGLDSPTGLHHIFYNRLKPRYQVPDKDSFDDGFYIVAPTFWTTRAWDFMFSKRKDKAKYDDELRKAFQMPPLDVRD